jgi:guanylate kinase
MIVMAGPTGVGKSSSLQFVQQEFDLDAFSFKKFLVDDLVENSEMYKKQVDTIITSLCDNDSSDKCSEKILNEKAKEAIPLFSNAYFSSRQKGCCPPGDPPYCSCEHINLNSMDQAIARKKNIVFETTMYVIDHIYNVTQNYGYKVIVTFSIAKLSVMIERMKKRLKESFSKYIQDRKIHPAPRLPNFSADFFEKNVREIEDRIVKTVSLQKTKYLPNGRGPYEFHLLILNNSAEKGRPQLIYDSSDPNEADIEKLAAQIHQIIF